MVRPARPKKKGWEKMNEGVRDGRPVLAVTVAGTLVLALVVFYAGFPALAASVEPIEISGNHTCGALAAQFGGGQTWIEFKKDSGPADGVFGDGTLSVTVTNSDTHQFDWSSNIGLDAVFVKAGNGGFLYLYDPPGPEATADTDLIGSAKSAISHISYCYDPEDTSTTSSTTEPPTTTTTIKDEISPTSIVSTTTTMVGTTTTIVGTTVSSTADTLPFTGFENGTAGLLALVLVATGALALVGTRVFREETDE
ncbi:MAG: hypothetical protein O7B77_01900 [Actinobacteria bacterium]|nr:hypothetical protein [Actinomycetota bacterium]